jgi:hypothetical protein
MSPYGRASAVRRHVTLEPELMKTIDLSVSGPDRDYASLCISIMGDRGQPHPRGGVIGSEDGAISLCRETGIFEDWVRIDCKADFADVHLMLNAQSAAKLGAALIEIAKNAKGRDN